MHNWFELYGHIDFSDCLLIAIVWTIKFGHFLLTGIIREIDLGYCINWNCPHN